MLNMIYWLERLISPHEPTGFARIIKGHCEKESSIGCIGGGLVPSKRVSDMEL